MPGKLDRGDPEPPQNSSFLSNSISEIGQLDGNTSIISTDVNETEGLTFPRIDIPFPASTLPIIASHNMRSLFPKVQSFQTDMIERRVDVAFLQETLEHSDKESHEKEIETMLEIHGLQYKSSPSPLSKKGYAYGGVALVVNKNKYVFKELNITPPSNLEVIWGRIKPKSTEAEFKNILLCSILFTTWKTEKCKASRSHRLNPSHALCFLP